MAGALNSKAYMRPMISGVSEKTRVLLSPVGSIAIVREPLRKIRMHGVYSIVGATPVSIVRVPPTGVNEMTREEKATVEVDPAPAEEVAA